MLNIKKWQIFTGKWQANIICPWSVRSTLYKRLQLHQDLWWGRGTGWPADGPVWSVGKSCSAFRWEKERLLHWMWSPWWWVLNLPSIAIAFDFQESLWATLWFSSCATSGPACWSRQTHLPIDNSERNSESMKKMRHTRKDIPTENHYHNSNITKVSSCI